MRFVKWVAFFVVSLLFAVAAPANAESTQESSRIPSTFLSVQRSFSWSDAQWTRQFDDLRAAGFSEVILNGVLVEENGIKTAYYPSSIPGTVPATSSGGTPVDVVSTVLQQGRRTGIRVWLGTYIPDSAWFSMNDSNVTAMTADNASITEQVIAELDQIASSFSDVVAGWYLSSEVSAKSAWSWKAGTALSSYYSRLVATAKASNVTQRTLVSPYYNIAGLSDPNLWTSLWKRILTAAPIDVVALQSGTGDTVTWQSQELQAQQLRTKFSATRAAIVAAGSDAELWANLNFYDYLGWYNPIGDVAKAHESVSPYVDGYTAWSYSIHYAKWTLGTSSYATPFALWNTGGSLSTAPPSAPTGVTEVANQLRWDAATASGGNSLAYYRILSEAGEQLGAASLRDRAFPLPATSGCVGVQTVDTAGNTSSLAQYCR